MTSRAEHVAGWLSSKRITAVTDLTSSLGRYVPVTNELLQVAVNAVYLSLVRNEPTAG